MLPKVRRSGRSGVGACLPPQTTAKKEKKGKKVGSKQSPHTTQMAEIIHTEKHHHFQSLKFTQYQESNIPLLIFNTPSILFVQALWRNRSITTKTRLEPDPGRTVQIVVSKSAFCGRPQKPSSLFYRDTKTRTCHNRRKHLQLSMSSTAAAVTHLTDFILLIPDFCASLFPLTTNGEWGGSTPRRKRNRNTKLTKAGTKHTDVSARARNSEAGGTGAAVTVPKHHGAAGTTKSGQCSWVRRGLS